MGNLHLLKKIAYFYQPKLKFVFSSTSVYFQTNYRVISIFLFIFFRLSHQVVEMGFPQEKDDNF